MKFACVLTFSIVFLTSSSSFAASPKQLAKMITEIRVGLKPKASQKLIAESQHASDFVNGLNSGRKVWSALGGNTLMGKVFISVESTPQITFISPAATKGKYPHKSHVEELYEEFYKLNSDIKSYSIPAQQRALGHSVKKTAPDGTLYSVVKFNMNEENLRQLDIYDFEKIISDIAEKVQTYR